ncbi:MAG TPA: hypothetical protein VLX56_03440 [Nitrososphaerales archaeon]|nr:hypothetical protein [Nitrososphaerales archaeon]
MSKEGSRFGRLQRFAVLRIVWFAIATGLGFLIAEGILILGFFALYKTLEVPEISDSPTILGLDALALGIGSTAAFLVNERVTVTKHDSRTTASWPVRWAKYQFAKLLGNIIIVVVQLVLFASISLSPALGSIVGAIVSYPVTYAFSMRFVWRLPAFKDLLRNKDGEGAQVAPSAMVLAVV